jgi:hypothetical protein
MQSEGRRQFRIGRCLGRGGFGEVYRATARSAGGLETVVALKVLRSDLKTDDDAVLRLRDEGRVLARVSHPAVVRAHDLTRVEGRIALVAEYVEGDDLDRFLRPPDAIGPRALFEACATLAAALDAAWSTPGADGAPLHIVHRDVKPTNVRLGRHGQVKLLDFGIARFSAGDRESRTQSDVVMGSLPYMAPERFIERATLPASDVFGVGCILFEGLVGERFHVDGQLRALSAMALEPVRYDAHLQARIGRIGGPPERGALVADCLRLDPAERPSAALLAARLEALADATEGPTLRRWCADRAWPEPAPIAGELEGRTVTEGSLAVAPDPADIVVVPIGRPAVNARPLGTIDPAMFDDGPGGPLPGRVSPVAPSAFPSLPIGVALEDLTGEARQVALSRTPDDLPERAPRSRLPGMLLGAGCVVAIGLLGLSLGFAAVVIGVALAL